MRKQDWYAIGVVVGVIAAFAVIPGMMDGFIAATNRAPYCMSFAKFAVLATFGECIGLRITTGNYHRPGFGLLPKALVWGFLGVGIKAAFTIFATGAPNILAELGLPVSVATLKTGDFPLRLLTAFSISVTINTIFAPVFMTLHKITDMHIAATGGTFAGFFTPIPMGRFLQDTNWNVLWGFVFKKTLPFFWIPAHVITFLLPPQFQVLFAALLGIMLGVILACAALKPKVPASA